MTWNVINETKAGLLTTQGEDTQVQSSALPLTGGGLEAC